MEIERECAFHGSSLFNILAWQFLMSQHIIIRNMKSGLANSGTSVCTYYHTHTPLEYIRAEHMHAHVLYVGQVVIPIVVNAVVKDQSHCLTRYNFATDKYMCTT